MRRTAYRRTDLNYKSRILSKIVMIVTFVIFAILALSFLVPFIWLILSSFKTIVDYELYAFSIPSEWRWKNYVEVFRLLKARVTLPNAVIEYGFPEMIGYSFVIAIGRGFMSVFMPAIAAYVVSKYRFKLRSVLYMTSIYIMIIPIVGALPSQMVIYKTLGIYDNILPFILLTTGSFGYTFLLIYASFKGVSWSYAESAFMDGAGHFRVMFQIMFPMMMPVFCTLFVLSFITNWNDYLIPVTWLPSYPNLAYGMYKFQADASKNGVGMPTILAGFVVVMIPTIILYALSQKMIMSNLKMGGLKG